MAQEANLPVGMYLEIDVDSGDVALADPDNFKQFHIAARGDGTDGTIARVLGADGRLCAEPNHVMVSIELVRRLAEPQVDAGWAEGFDKMLGFAAKMGWIDESGNFVKAHTEWPVLDGVNLWDLIERRAAATPNLEAACDETGRRLSFGEFKSEAERVAAALWQMGTRPNDVVSWELPSWIDSMVLSAAISRIDAVQNPIIAIYREREVGFCVRQARAKLLVVPGTWRGYDYGAMAESIAATVEGLSVLSVARGALPVGDPAVLPPPPAKVAPADAPVRWLCYTSGTTSDPKGARHPDHTHLIVARAACARMLLAHGDRPSLVFPFPHIGGIMWMFAALQYGAALLFDEAFDANRTPQYLSSEGCTHPGSGTPFHLVYLDAQRRQPDAPLFPRAKVFPSGGSPTPPQLFYDVKRVFGAPIVTGWGLTEVPILTMGTPKDPEDKLAPSEGRLMPGCDVVVVTTDGRRAGPGEIGELRGKAPQMMRGYLDERLNADAFDADGYFRTGDLGYIDEDGYLYITGRLKDVIIRNAENISANEVEDLLFAHERVHDVAVIGVPDPKTGERVCAIVVTPEGQLPLGFAEMQQYLRDKGLRTQAIPERLEFAASIPRNPAGKIQKNVLREQYR